MGHLAYIMSHSDTLTVVQIFVHELFDRRLACCPLRLRYCALLYFFSNEYRLEGTLCYVCIGWHCWCTIWFLQHVQFLFDARVHGVFTCATYIDCDLCRRFP